MGGRELTFEVVGDCCSQSFFDADTKLDLGDILGHTLRKIETVMVGRVLGVGDNETKTYMTKLTTDRGNFTLAWRNESNGYYSGSLRFRIGEELVESWEFEKLNALGIVAEED